MASIREHKKKDGSSSWYVLWRDPDLGKQTSMSVATKPQAANMKRLLDANGQRLALVEKAMVAAAAPEKLMTLNEAFERHLDLRTRANEATVKNYRRMWTRHNVDVELGGLAVARVTEDHIRAWVKDQSKRYSPKSMSNIMGLLSSVFKTATARGWAAGNPSEMVELGYGNATERAATFLTHDEFWLLHDGFAPRHSLLVRTLVASGLRYSEITALGVDGVLDGLQRQVPALPVTRAWKEHAAGGYYLGAPKAESVRDVSIPSDLAEEILETIDGRSGDDLVFPNQAGTQLRSSTFHQHGWQAAVRLARTKGLRKTPRPHDLRHTHASWMLAEGISVYDLSKRLGHKSTNTTEQIYGHLMPKALSEGADAIARAMTRR